MSAVYIEGDEQISLPPTVQEQLRSHYEDLYMGERDMLLQKISSVKEELENSQKAFDLYRDRAKASCQKLAVDVQTVEGKLSICQDHLKVRHDSLI